LAPAITATSTSQEDLIARQKALGSHGEHLHRRIPKQINFNQIANISAGESSRRLHRHAFLRPDGLVNTAMTSTLLHRRLPNRPECIPLPGRRNLGNATISPCTP